MKAYVIRTQGLGVLHDTVFIGGPPPMEYIEKAMAAELARHGFDKENGDVCDRWVSYQEIEVVESAPDETEVEFLGARIVDRLTTEEAEALRSAPVENCATGEPMFVGGLGTVSNPE
jgi:hypothetical protein